VIEVGSYWRYIFSNKVVQITEVGTITLVAEWEYSWGDDDEPRMFSREYDIEYFLTQFKQLTPLEAELL